MLSIIFSVLYLNYFVIQTCSTFLIVSGSILTEANQVTLADINSDGYDSVHQLSIPSSSSDSSHSSHIAHVILGCEHIISTVNPDICIVYVDR